MSRKAQDTKFIDNILKDLSESRKGESDTELRLKIIDREIKLLALKRQLKDDGFGKGFDLGGEDE